MKKVSPFESGTFTEGAMNCAPTDVRMMVFKSLHLMVFKSLYYACRDFFDLRKLFRRGVHTWTAKAVANRNLWLDGGDIQI